MSLARTLGAQSFLAEKPIVHTSSTVSPKQLATILANGSKSFALAGKFLGAREYVDAALLYAWCRQADDRIDDVAKNEVPNALRQLRCEVDELYDGQAHGPLAEALQNLIVRRSIPRAYLHALVDGFAMDSEGTSYESLRDLDQYAYRVAGVVGLMMCHVLGLKNERSLVAAAQLGMAMQLTNIARDVAEDWQRGRQYLPRSLIRPEVLSLASTTHDPSHPSRKAVGLAVAVVLERAEDYYRRGLSGLRDLGWRNALAIGAAGRIYRAIGRRLAARGWTVFAGRIVVSLPRKLACSLGSLGALLFDSPRRWRERGGSQTIPTKTVRFEDVIS